MAEIRLMPAEPPRAFTGTLRPRREAELAFRTGGRISERLVEPGERVSAGQALARLDAADLALALRAAEAELSAAEAERARTAADAERARALRAGGHIAAAALDQRETAARAAAERAEAAAAALALARNRLSYATLTAPSAGIVTAILAERGQVVAEGRPVLRLADLAEREIEVAVPEAALPALSAPGATARFWALPEAALPVRLREVSPQAQGALRTYAARFALADAPEDVALGMTATVHLPARGAPVAAVPLSALHDRGQGPMVWRVENGRAVAVPVEVVRLTETTALLRGPFGEGERIVSLGPQLLEPGMAVRVVDTRLAATLR
ncbi:MAG: efflux RND transporter periplasmic adaptor subunit [Acetobacteraceae bacterium]|nr:efflux RND transporter periplasmic adaptor subunit [Acetobacteraceae bacterium]